MTETTAPLGTLEWVTATGGRLTTEDVRRLLRPVAAAHAVNVVGRLAMLVRLNAGRRVDIDVDVLQPPSSPVTP